MVSRGRTSAKGATTGHMHCSKHHLYSIIASAQAGSRAHRGRASSRWTPSHSAVVLLESEKDREDSICGRFGRRGAVFDQMHPIRRKAVAIYRKTAHGEWQPRHGLKPQQRCATF